MSALLISDPVVAADDRDLPEKNTSWSDEAKTAYNSLMTTKKMTSGNLAVLTTNQIQQYANQIFDPFAILRTTKAGGHLSSESDTDSCTESDSSDTD